jgi:hypothetical protein
MDLKTRVHAFMMLSKFTGMEVTSQFLRETLKHFPQVEAEAAHIIPVKHKGPDDPRICRPEDEALH